MKRIFAFLLAAVLALSLCACSSEPNKYQALNDMLDRGDYDAAMQYIENISGGKNNTPGGDPGGDPGDGDTPGGDDGSSSGDDEIPQPVLMPLLYGEWHVTSEQDDQPYTITVKEDGTCLIGEAAYTWKLDPNLVHSDTSLRVEVYDGETHCHALRIEKNENSNRVQLALGTPEENGNFVHYNGDYYYNDAHYRIVPVTKENWREYFELVETGRFEYNAFGEYEDFSLLSTLRLKEEHQEKLSTSLTNVVLELSWVPGKQGCTVDPATETYTLNDWFEVQWQWEGQRETGIYTFEPHSKDHSITLMNCWYDPVGENEGGHSHAYWYKSDLQLERVQGSLYFLNIEE